MLEKSFSIKLQFPELDGGMGILLVGTGGTGGYVLQFLARIRYAANQISPFLRQDLTLADGDKVEEKNLLRQHFIAKDVGFDKATVLAQRYERAYGLPIYAYSRYIENTGALRELLPNYGRGTRILMGAVDNNATRQIMHRFFLEEAAAGHSLIYLDAGNDGVLHSEIPEFKMKAKQKAEQRASGYSGQVVVGYTTQGKIVLPPVCEVYPDILEDKESQLPTQHACGVQVVSHPQRMMTNVLAGNILSAYLNSLIFDHEIHSHYTNFNAQTMLTRPVYLTREYLAGVMRDADAEGEAG